MVTIPIIFRTKPVLAIWGTVRYPELNITALGGVATGSMNANDAAIVPPIIKRKGCTFIAIAVTANIGRKILVIAVLDVTSVKKSISSITIITANIIGTVFKKFKFLAE